MSETITQIRAECVRRSMTSPDTIRRDTFLRSTSLQKILCSPHMPILPSIIVWVRSSKKSFHENAESWRIAVRFFLVQCALHLAQGVPTFDVKFYKSYISQATPYFKDLVLVCAVYLSVGITVFELLGCLLALNSTSVPPGLSFMIASLGLIGFVIIKVLFINHNDFCSMEKCVKCKNVKESKPAASPRRASESITKKSEFESPKQQQSRQSRNRTRRVVHLYFGDKTLSKIKLF